MNFWLFRHGLTQGNLERRYVGCRTDEPLTPQGRLALESIKAPKVHRVYCSPLKRCLESAKLLYPDRQLVVVPDLRECDFGAFEGLRYEDLSGDPAYRRWIDAGGAISPPGGESRQAFIDRCAEAFHPIWEQEKEDCALVIHGGTIMAILSVYAKPSVPFYAIQPRCGEAVLLTGEGRVIA